MRLWSFHPQYLDDTGLRRLWNEALIAARALAALQRGEKRGYQHHSQLARFKTHPEPVQAISNYLHCIAAEAQRRRMNYPKAFKREYIPLPESQVGQIPVTAGQLEYEIWHYGAILSKRRGCGEAYCEFWSVVEHRVHPLFTLVRGAVERWEKL